MEVQRIRIRGVKRVVIPQSAQMTAGQGTIIEIKGKRRRKRKKQSMGLKLLEKIARRSARSSNAMFDQYLQRHNRSNRKKRDGWMKDLPKNMFNSMRKSRKRFKLSTLF